MLSRIEIRNFAIIQSLNLDWSNGMSVVTGETGAGKSIVIDALGLALGDRAEQSVIYPGAKQAEVTALFTLSASGSANAWLIEHELAEEDECILRRVVIKEGRTKCFINGRSVTQSQLKTFGSLLVDIHGQHAQQSLLKPKEQLALLDRYANHPQLLVSIADAAKQIKAIDARKQALISAQNARDARRELLAYQVEELAEADPNAEKLNALELEHKQAATSQDRLLIAQNALHFLAEDEQHAVLSQLARVIEQVRQLHSLDPTLMDLQALFEQAQSLMQEARSDLSHYRDGLDVDPQKLAELDAQLSLFHDLARKHQVNIEQLPERYQQLTKELDQIQADDNALCSIEKEYQQAIKNYQQQADKLSSSRKKTAKQLEKLISEKIQGLAMEGGQLKIQLEPQEHQYLPSGAEKITFYVSANPGQPLQPLDKVASGGELSRISLAIAVITAEQQPVPTIIFDEVDVGIGGGTAETVGLLLKQLANQRQVICVTHQPQVAACGDQHLVAAKTKLVDQTMTKVEQLNPDERVEELARMLGGKVISEKTRSHAKEMLSGS